MADRTAKVAAHLLASSPAPENSSIQATLQSLVSASRGEEEATAAQSGRSTTPRQDEQPVRAPRGPDGSGRGGFGFSRRGGAKEGS